MLDRRMSLRSWRWGCRCEFEFNNGEFLLDNAGIDSKTDGMVSTMVAAVCI